MDRVNWMLILTGEVVLVLEAECLKTFQVRFVVLHRLRLSPWAYASSPLARGFFTSAVVFFPFCLCGFFLVATVNGHSRHFAECVGTCTVGSFSRSGSLSSPGATRVFITAFG